MCALRLRAAPPSAGVRGNTPRGRPGPGCQRMGSEVVLRAGILLGSLCPPVIAAKAVMTGSGALGTGAGSSGLVGGGESRSGAAKQSAGSRAPRKLRETGPCARGRWADACLAPRLARAAPAARCWTASYVCELGSDGGAPPCQGLVAMKLDSEEGSGVCDLHCPHRPHCRNCPWSARTPLPSAICLASAKWCLSIPGLASVLGSPYRRRCLSAAISSS